MPPKKGSIRDVVTQLIYAAAGDKEQYEETVDAVVGAFENYLYNLTTTALKCAENPNRITPDDIGKAMENDPQKQSRAQKHIEQIKQFQAEKKNVLDSTT